MPPHVLLPWGKYITIGLAAFTALVLFMGIVYSAGVLLSAKADKSEVEKLRDEQSSVKADIAVIKNDVATIKNWLIPAGER